MATIKISELNPIGSELFSDSESYIEELSEVELDTLNINGGGTPLIYVTTRYALSIVTVSLTVYLGE